MQEEKQGGGDITVVTVATPSRLEALEAQCRSWSGPLAAALYLPLVDFFTPLPGSLGGGGSRRRKRGGALAEDAQRQLDEVERSANALFQR